MIRVSTYIRLFTLIAAILPSLLWGQDVEFTASVNRSNVKTGDRFKVEFRANTSLDNFKPPNLSNFRVLSGPNQSTSMSWVNGKTSSSITYSYILMATKEGEFTIGPANGVVDEETYKTNSLTVSVGKGVKVQSNNQQNQKKVTASDELFIKASINKNNIYVGEQIIVTYQLYTRVNIAGNELIKKGDLNGFWSQEIDLGQTNWRNEVIGGYRYSVATIRKAVLFPQRSGNLEIDPLEMKFIVQKRVSGGQSVFDQFFGRVENVEYDLKSKPIKVTVKALPQPQPDGFAGAVGKLNMKVTTSTSEVKANEAVNIKIKYSGKGNIPLLDNPEINFPADFETYDPKINNNVRTNASGVSGSKEYDYLVIPRHPGQFKLDPMVFSYFNPSTKKYETVESEPISINVLKADGSTSDNVVFSSPNKEDIKVLGEDIRYIHLTNVDFSNTSQNLFGSMKFYILFFLAPILFILTYVFRNKIREVNSDTVRLKSKKANKVANKLLSSAKKSLTDNQKVAFYEDISKALFGYVGDKLNIPSSELNQSNIKDKLTQFGVNTESTNELLETIELCEMARFAPVSVSEQAIYSKAESIINKIEEEVKG